MIKIYRCSKYCLLMKINCTSVRFLLLLFIETPTVGSRPKEPVLLLRELL